MEAVGNVLGFVAVAVIGITATASLIAGLLDTRTWKTWLKRERRPSGKPAELLTLPLWLAALPVIATARGAAALAMRFTALRRERRGRSD
ncbi:MAG: hypothetical protein R2689_00075 [Microthrixaceae bacterium]